MKSVKNLRDRITVASRVIQCRVRSKWFSFV